MAGLNLPERLHLAQLPTPVQPLERLSADLGVTVLVKRDDLTGAPLSGNKIRKLEFLFAEALAEKAAAVITCGGLQSNHARATAVAARRLGLEPHLLLRTEDGTEPSPPDGNHFIDRLVGANIRTCTLEQWRQRDQIMESWAEELRASGTPTYVIPEGGSNARGALGYVRMVEELFEQLKTKGYPSDGIRQADYIVHACGSGGTTAGLAIGAYLYWKNAIPVAFSVADDEPYFRDKIDGIADDFIDQFGGFGVPEDLSYIIVDGYKGAGYALSTAPELDFIHSVAKREGLLLDPVYTGKAFYGMVQEIRAGKTFRKGSTVLFVHTGGLFGLFPKRSEFDFD